MGATAKAFVPTPAGWLFLGLAGLCLVAQAGGHSWQELLEYQRTGLEKGQLWRLFSAHLVHLGWAHALMNIVGLGLLIALFGMQTSPRVLVLLLAVSALAVDAGLWFLHPELQWYVGLSGALHGLLAGLLLLQWTTWNRRYRWLILLLSVKLAWEFVVGPLPVTAEIAGGPVVSQAHLFGALGGMLAALVISVVTGRTLME
ncbi:MAG: rhombosortase [Gammaproteobacteria bacterium]|nr:rhombosortase [Gammaproteobacteria bacterium]